MSVDEKEVTDHLFIIKYNEMILSQINDQMRERSAMFKTMSESKDDTKQGLCSKQKGVVALTPFV